jgi:hypothetical protein
MSEKKKIPTTVKVEEQLYNDFKVLGIRHKLTLQALVERCIYRYVNEETFRRELNNFSPPVVGSLATTGSAA